ncbi:MAG: GNAT family N-acetyltransferase [Myxococcaceae bacterium]
MAGADEAVLNIRGEKVGLGPLRRDALPSMTRWMNDFEVTRTLAVGMKPVTAEAEEAWYQSAAQGGHDRLFLIHRLSDLRAVGSCGLHRVDLQHGLAELGILIGEKDCWGKGYGTEACRLLLDYGFNVLGLYSVMLRAFGNNAGGVKAYERAGFKEFGRWRGAVRMGSERFDMIHMDCLASEFRR